MTIIIKNKIFTRIPTENNVPSCRGCYLHNNYENCTNFNYEIREKLRNFCEERDIIRKYYILKETTIKKVKVL